MSATTSINSSTYSAPSLNGKGWGGAAAFLFDLDGTLIDTEPQYTEFWKQVGEELCPHIPDFAYRIKGTTLGNIFDTYFPEKEVQDQLLARLKAHHETMSYPLFEGAKEFVEAAKAQGVRCAIVTSSNQEKMEAVWNAQREFMNLFDAVLTEEDFSASKPDPDCYLKAAERLQAPIENCVVFEDAPNGLAAGMAAKMLVVGIASGLTHAELQGKCHRSIDNFVGVTPEIVNSWLASCR